VHKKLENPKLVLFDEYNLTWKPARRWILHIGYLCIVVGIAWYAFFMGRVTAKPYTAYEYIYFPCAREMVRDPHPRWAWKQVQKAFEDSQFKQPIQLNIQLPTKEK
jgi:hypothetical protein